MSIAERTSLGGIACAALLVLFVAPLAGWPSVVRLPAVLLPALLLALLVTRVWSWPELDRRAAAWEPSRRLVLAAVGIAALVLFWYVLTRFRSGQINAIDFTIYYDRPCYQTVHGRPLFVEVSDTPGFSQRSELADHAYWAMLGVCSLYALHPSPIWLHMLSVVAVVTGAVFVLRILQRVGTGGVVACAGALAFVLNDNTARTLNYGFHPEVLYACFVPWLLDAGLRRSRRSFLAAALACILVKEDAWLPLFAAAAALALHRFREMSRSERVVYLALPTLVAIGNLLVYYQYVLPLLGGRTYAHFWGTYGDTPLQVFLGMWRHPLRVLQSTLTSGVRKVLAPHLFLPLVGWRWSLGVAPIVVLYGASANDQLRAFGIYYAIVLVPFLILAQSTAALSLARRLVKGDGRARIAAAAVIVMGAILVGSGDRGYSLRPWRREITGVPAALARLRDEPVVLVQSGLFPHAGHDERFILLTPDTLRDPRHAGAAVLLAQGIDAYPLRDEDVARLRALPELMPLPANMRAVRLPAVAGDAAGR